MEKKEITQQLEFYKKENMKIHIELNNGRFYNGFILEIAGDMLIFDDSSLGAIPIYFLQVTIVEKYKEKKE